MDELVETPSSCHRCGQYCTNVRTPPIVTWSQDGDAWLASLPPDLRRDYQAKLAQRLADDDDTLPCFWYDPADRGCQHYDHRPQICRDFLCNLAPETP